MLIAILGDLHFGARNSNQVTARWQQKFFEEIFWPEIDKRGISTILQTGDYFDNRKWINLQTMAFQREMFVKPVQERDIEVYGIIGNHDIPLRHSLANSSPEQILNHEANIEFYNEIKEFEFDDRKITLVPWICKENEEEILNRIREGGDIIMGHFEIMGSVMHPGAFCIDGLKPSDFDGWNKVWSGHFHTQSQTGNIHYVGTPYQMTWNDAKGKNGFWIYNTVDDSMEYVDNPYSYFHRIYWNDGTDYDVTKLNDAYVKIQVQQKTDFEQFETFLDQVNFNSPFEVKIIESFEEYNQENIKEMIQLSSTEDLISEYIEDVATTNNKDKIKEVMLSIYEEAMSIDDQV